MEEKSRIICVSCPKGCTLEVTHTGATVLKVLDAGCKRGEVYVRQELSDPRRMVATTVRIEGGIHPLLPVATKTPFPKPLIPDLMIVLRTIKLPAPIRMGDVVVKNVLDTGVDIIASRDISRL
ncbi:MAG: DUF1667 domain-containing protein [Anaerolineaceae bacterium]|nr:DUF1667 domain-containing protein [Anaerolineaceae bacterium]